MSTAMYREREREIARKKERASRRRSKYEKWQTASREEDFEGTVTGDRARRVP